MADKKKKELTIRISAAEYLTFVASAGQSDVGFEMRYEDENIWLTQKMMAALYDVGLSTINEHIKRIYDDGELNYSEIPNSSNGRRTAGKPRCGALQFAADYSRRLQGEQSACCTVSQMGGSNRKRTHHSGLDDGCGTPEKRPYVHR